MKNLLIPFTLIFLSFFNPISANTNTNKTDEKIKSISGYIADYEEKEALAGVSITANGEKIYSDLNGKFTLTNLCEENCLLYIQMISYKTQEINVDFNKKEVLKIALQKR